MNKTNESILVIAGTEAAERYRSSIFVAQNGFHDVEIVSNPAQITQVLLEMQKCPRAGALIWVDCPLSVLRENADVFRAALNIAEDSFWLFIVDQNRTDEELETLFKGVSAHRWCSAGPFSARQCVRFARVHAETAARASRAHHFRKMVQVARGLGHEFSNILFKIGGRADLLSSEPAVAADSRVQQQLEQIFRAVEHGGKLVTELQTLPKGGLRRPFESVGLDLPIQEALRLEKRTLSGLHVVTALGRSPACLMDVSAMTQVFINLLRNAARAMPEGGELTVTLKTEPRGGAGAPPWAVAVIQDHGVGISPDILPRIFDFGFSAWGEQQGGKGAGVGLGIALALADAHGARIEVASELGKGTAFTVVFPPGGS